MAEFTKWDPNTNYDYLDRKGEYQHANGSLPDGALVRVAGIATGHVVHSNSERSLVHCENERAWYPNDSLEVESA